MAKETQKLKVIAVDSGKFNMKIRDDEKILIYENHYNEGSSDLFGGLVENTWNVGYKGGFYTVGQSADDEDSQEGKGSFAHILETLTGVTLFLDPKEKNDNIVLIYGESLNPYSNVVNREEIVRQLEGNHSLTVNDIQYNFTIKNVHIIPEGMGHIICEKECGNGLDYVIDIGGKTINFLKVNKKKVDLKESTSYPLGVNNIIALIAERCNKNGIGINVDEAKEFLISGTSEVKVQQIINAVINEQFREIEKKLHLKGVDLKKLTEVFGVWFIGGGTLLLKEQIKSRYGSKVKIPENPLTANVDGSYKFGVLKYGK